ncbi:unnamed protein product [Triticum turgidum subsp. durum]|uniref:Uncharacterized protein n=1 Tax=Triticum turgidum subsp. durum TaxID=4567 RepID=A0A9R0T727_TRITD|nr:unnamed protein product [Triticum turgidum subsp. durum]
MEDCAATPVRRPADPSSPSLTPSPLSLRQWRPAAQRNLRNQWSRLLAAKTRWLDAAASGRSHAATLVNAYLSRSYMPGMDLGVLKDMPRIRDRASAKLAHKEVATLSPGTRPILLSSIWFNFLVHLLIFMSLAWFRCNAARCFYQPTRRWSVPCPTWLKLLMPCGSSKVSAGSPLVRFTDRQDDLNDLGDGGGAPVYRWVSMLEFGGLLKCMLRIDFV